jgi:hypothetical protein
VTLGTLLGFTALLSNQQSNRVNTIYPNKKKQINKDYPASMVLNSSFFLKKKSFLLVDSAA